MSDPLDYFNKVNYNIRGFETTNQVIIIHYKWMLYFYLHQYLNYCKIDS